MLWLFENKFEGKKLRTKYNVIIVTISININIYYETININKYYETYNFDVKLLNKNCDFFRENF